MDRGEEVKITHKVLPLKKVFFDIRATAKCMFCEHYGKSARCPPNIPGAEYWNEVIRNYSSGDLVVVTATYTGPADFEKARVKSSQYLLKELRALERAYFNQNKYWVLSFSGGSCRFCETCAGTVCRFPHESRVSMEGAGIDVFRTCEHHGVSLPKYPFPRDFGDVCRVGIVLVE